MLPEPYTIKKLEMLQANFPLLINLLKKPKVKDSPTPRHVIAVDPTISKNPDPIISTSPVPEHCSVLLITGVTEQVIVSPSITPVPFINKSPDDTQ